MSTNNEKDMSIEDTLRLALEALTANMATHGFREHIEEAQDKAIKALETALQAHKALAQSRSDDKQEQRSDSDSEQLGEPVAEYIGNNPEEPDLSKRIGLIHRLKFIPLRSKLYTTPYVPEGRQQRPSRSDIKPLTREVIDRDFHGRVDFVRQVEAAHGITKE